MLQNAAEYRSMSPELYKVQTPTKKALRLEESENE